MTARQRRLARTRCLQRARQGERAARAWRAWFASIGPRRCERCGVRDEAVWWVDAFRGWYHPDCAEAEMAEESP